MSGGGGGRPGSKNVFSVRGDILVYSDGVARNSKISVHDMYEEIEGIKSDMIDLVLLSGSTSEAVSVYDMSYEQYSELKNRL